MTAPIKIAVCKGCNGLGDHINLLDPFGPRTPCRGCGGWGVVPNFDLSSMRKAHCPITEKEEFSLAEKWFREMVEEVA